MSAIQPRAATMLRVYGGGTIGSTAFFRNRPLLETLTELIRERGQPRLRMLFHACSIGAEPYSFIIHSIVSGLANSVELRVFATDVNPEFIATARAGIYPAQILEGMTEAEKAFFAPAGEGAVALSEEVRRRVEFMAPASFVEFATEERFDVVLVLNALTYVSETEQARALDNIGRYNAWLLVTSAFHPDTVREDLERAGYAPVLWRQEAIHNAWVERIRHNMVPEKGTSPYSWVLPPWAPIADHEYRYCALFAKTGSAG